MFTLSAFWRAAAACSGKLDLSVLDRADPSTWSAAELVGAGLSQVIALRGGQPLKTDQPFLTLADPRYPAQLARVPFAPPVLFYQGDLELLQRPGVALVGARKCSQSGASMARACAAALAGAGVSVVSGMAYGVDTAAHRAAPGATIAVLGHSLNATISRARRALADEIVSRGGLLLSEFLPGFPPSPRTFPLRNRIIAWLSLATVVVEASQRSGALITARAALSAGRDVFAVPGHPYQLTYAGCLRLIDQGAPMVRSPDELLDRLDLPQLPPPADPLLQLIGQGATLDQLLRRSPQPAAVLTRALATLELSGVIERLPGDRYAPTRSRARSG